MLPEFRRGLQIMTKGVARPRCTRCRQNPAAFPQQGPCPVPHTSLAESLQSHSVRVQVFIARGAHLSASLQTVHPAVTVGKSSHSYGKTNLEDITKPPPCTPTGPCNYIHLASTSYGPVFFVQYPTTYTHTSWSRHHCTTAVGSPVL